MAQRVQGLKQSSYLIKNKIKKIGPRHWPKL